MTARLATHPAVAAQAPDIVARLTAAGVDVEPVAGPLESVCPDGDPLAGLRAAHVELAVVGMQSLRGTAADALTMLAVLPREDPRDVLVCLEGEPGPLRALSRGARVGVSGFRRAAWVRALRPDVETVEISPGWPAEPGKRDGPDPEALQAVVLWGGDARRARLADRIGEVLDVRSWPPEPGQGAIAILGRHPIAEIIALDHLPTRTALRAELALLDALDAPPRAGLGTLAQPSGRLLRLWAGIASTDGARVVRAEITGPLDEPEQLGASAARRLVERGARLLLDALPV